MITITIDVANSATKLIFVINIFFIHLKIKKMKATINGIVVEGTPEEIVKYENLKK